MKLDPVKRWSIATLASLLTLWAAQPAAAADSLTVASWGGAYARSQIEALHKPFTARTGITMLSEIHGGGLAEIRVQSETGAPSWDLVDLNLASVVRGCDEGLLEPLDLTALPPSPGGKRAQDDFFTGTLHRCGVASTVWSTIYAYDDNKFPVAKPSRIEDFFDTIGFPGRRGLRRSPNANLEFALMADGVPPNEVYDVLSTPEGIDRAFAKLDSIKDQVLWWQTGGQPPQLLADGEVVMTTAYHGQIFNAQLREGRPFVIVWDGQIWDIDLWAIPRGSRNKAQAMEFIRFATDSQRLADQASWIAYGPTRESSLPLVGRHAEAGIQMLPHLPTAPNNFLTAVQHDFDFWLDFQDELEERFRTWLAR